MNLSQVEHAVALRNYRRKALSLRQRILTGGFDVMVTFHDGLDGYGSLSSLMPLEAFRSFTLLKVEAFIAEVERQLKEMGIEVNE